MLSQLFKKSTSSLILTKQVKLGPESKLLETNDLNDLEQIMLYTSMCNDAFCFRVATKAHSSLQWDCILFFVECNQSEKQGQGKPQMSKTMKKATEEN